MTERAERVRTELAELAEHARAQAARAVQQCADAARVADETTGQLTDRWNRNIAAMRKRPMAARADWRNDQMTDGQR